MPNKLTMVSCGATEAVEGILSICLTGEDGKNKFLFTLHILIQALDLGTSGWPL